MEKRFLDKVEDNAAVRAWSEMTQHNKGDSLTEGYVSELWDFTHVSVTQNGLQELKEIWDQWNEEIRQLFYSNYGNLPYLLDIKWVTARIQQKGDSKCVHWKSLKDIILVHPARVMPVPAILAETFLSLNACRRVGEGRFVRCAQLLLAWFHSHFWRVDKVSYRIFSKNYLPLKEEVATPRRDDISMEKWMAILQGLQEEDIEWRAPWLLPDEILYRCGDFDWVPLLEIWGAIGYTLC
ncbi:hypothetical protein Goshw_006057 [Gossypium schwendimanii]|uniref:DUF7745 domain-containing protein n=1 Tax=Gossypium schwendimanii TaxID=34291 RepID=A0A7J9NBQ9_GOSSC|nr:hypothetical protein [Gossypium schwendimanii]